jgi:hypothetical protein
MNDKIIFNEVAFFIEKDAPGALYVDNLSEIVMMNMQEIIELRNWLNKIIYAGHNEIVET